MTLSPDNDLLVRVLSEPLDKLEALDTRVHKFPQCLRGESEDHGRYGVPKSYVVTILGGEFFRITRPRVDHVSMIYRSV